ncbi:MAG: hypothetical protein EOO38_15555 [Cytophagaceae bacterium]|nr:MAG: hypothetical protein EOO38_15555 [Cytophagaceae bacterium]
MSTYKITVPDDPTGNDVVGYEFSSREQFFEFVEQEYRLNSVPAFMDVEPEQYPCLMAVRHGKREGTGFVKALCVASYFFLRTAS